MKNIVLDREARERLARQLAETTGLVTNCNGAKGRPE